MKSSPRKLQGQFQLNLNKIYNTLIDIKEREINIKNKYIDMTVVTDII